MPGGQILFMLQTTRNVDVECSIFPFLGPAFWNEELRQVALQSNGDLARYMAWSTPNGGIGQARVRCRTYSEGIAPAVLKKVLKNAKVTVKLEGLRKRG
jgi:hypothetical protein